MGGGNGAERPGPDASLAPGARWAVMLPQACAPGSRDECREHTHPPCASVPRPQAECDGPGCLKV